jgi:ubiquinol-cytochrome c reductase iron-sulfur subunit
MNSPPADKTRRQLVIATAAIGGVEVIGAAVPFVVSMEPSERARALGAPVEVDIAGIKPGELQTVEWRGQPVWILRRNKEMLDGVKKDDDIVVDPDSTVSTQQPDYARNEFRSIKPEFLILVGVCTHLGCSPQLKPPQDKPEMGPDWNGGFYCPCHGSKFDLAGRVFRGVPAPINLKVPPHLYLSDSKLLIGDDKKA